MNYEDYLAMGLNGEASLKLILCGEVDESTGKKIGVVSVIFATTNRDIAKDKIEVLNRENPNNYYMVYSVPLNTDLLLLDHYPSIEIRQEDLS